MTNKEATEAEKKLRSEMKWTLQKLFFMQKQVEIFSQLAEDELVLQHLLETVDSLKTEELASKAKQYNDMYASAQQH